MSPFPGYMPVHETFPRKIVGVHWPSGTFFFLATWNFVAVYPAALVIAEHAPPAGFCEPIIGPQSSPDYASTWTPKTMSWRLASKSVDAGLVVGNPTTPVTDFGDTRIIFLSVQVLPGAPGNPSFSTPTVSRTMEFWYFVKEGERGCFGDPGGPFTPHLTVEGTPFGLTATGSPSFPLSVTVPSSATYFGKHVVFSGGSMGWGGGGFGPPPYRFFTGPASLLTIRASYRLGPAP
jgi:hypothetical protein